jgi:hypothetical protein
LRSDTTALILLFYVPDAGRQDNEKEYASEHGDEMRWINTDISVVSVKLSELKQGVVWN